MVLFYRRKLKKNVLLFLLTCVCIPYFLQFLHFHYWKKVLNFDQNKSLHVLPATNYSLKLENSENSKLSPLQKPYGKIRNDPYFSNASDFHPEATSKSTPTPMLSPFHEPMSINPKVKTLSWEFVKPVNFKSRESYFVPKQIIVESFKFEYIISEENFCKKRSPFLLVMVPSLSGKEKIRNVIRDTWASVSKTQQWPMRIVNAEVKVIFLLGRTYEEGEVEKISEENHKHKDIVMADFADSYRNLSKKILIGLSWMKQFCPAANFILKCDEDTFVNIPLIVDFLLVFNPKLNFTVIGFIYPKSPVKRTGPWRVERTDYPSSVYPPYASGNAYVMSRDLVLHVLHVAKYMPYIPVEDAFITGILTRVVGGKHVHSNTYANLKDKPPEPCQFLHDERQACTRANVSSIIAVWKAFSANTC